MQIQGLFGEAKSAYLWKCSGVLGVIAAGRAPNDEKVCGSDPRNSRGYGKGVVKSGFGRSGMAAGAKKGGLWERAGRVEAQNGVLNLVREKNEHSGAFSVFFSNVENAVSRFHTTCPLPKTPFFCTCRLP